MTTAATVLLAAYAVSGVLVVSLVRSLRAARRRAEAKETELSLVTSRTPLLLTRCSRDRRYLFVNRAAAEFVGKTPEEIIGKTMAELAEPQALVAIEPHIQRVLSGETAEFEIEAPHGSGRAIMHVVYTPEWSGGEVVGWIGTIADVTAQRAAERALRESESRFRVMADAAPVLIWISGTDKLCTWFNKPWLEFVGRTMEQELGNGWADNVHPDDLSRCLAVYTTAFDARERFAMEYRLRRADGEFRWVLDHGIPRYEDSGAFVGYVGSCMDITDLKRNEDALREADRRKDEFLATLAHELRNPLAPVRNAVEILRLRGPHAPELAFARDVIDRQMRLMKRLIDDLMDVSRITRNRMELRRERVLLSDALETAIETSRGAIESAGQTLDVSLPDERLALDGDPARLAQVFANLLSNAAKFSEPGGRIVLTVERSGGDAVIRLRDEGIGIPAEMLPRIFEMFMQADRTIERARGGLGIGLTLVRQILAMHGGTIEARSDGPGRGSEFLVRLPLAAAVPAIPEAPAPERSLAPASARRRVLIADDNEDAAETLASMLSFLGYETRRAHDGMQALKACDEFHPEVALLDIGMPKVSGYDVARYLRSRPWGSGVLLVAITGWGQAEDRERAVEAGFDHHLVKPVDPDALASLLASEAAR